MIAVKSRCPHRDHSPEFAIVCDWLAANGIDEWLPEQPTFLVQDEPFKKRIIYRGWKFDGERGYDVNSIAEGYARLLEEDRIVPLLEPVTDEVRAAFRVLETVDATEGQAFLVEAGDAASMEAHRRRMGLPERSSRMQMLSNDTSEKKCLSLTARDGALHVKITDGFTGDDEALTDAFVLGQNRFARLIEDLPQLLEWLKSERPSGR